MSFIADLHVHSHWSRATSRECTLEGFARWAQLKGVRVVGTGDFTHPAWFAELQEKLVPAEGAPGLYRLKPQAEAIAAEEVPSSCRSPVSFMITGEISSIYKRAERTRKVHSLLLIPDFDAVSRINARLDSIGNITSDGRPILGLDPRHLLELTLEANRNAVFVPAHIWTPWFSMLGSKSGFDSIEECFGELSRHIFTVETGLSSDPPMNWRVSSLDGCALVSNSDLHSPAKLGRNANIFHGSPGFMAMRAALVSRDPALFGGTIDMFPEEGKYHCDGHRKCGVCLEPEESLAHDCRCPVCGKPLVLGVLHRVVKLADRPKGGRPPGTMPHEYIIPLSELLAEIYDCGAGTKKVARAYHQLLHRFGPELHILRELALERLEGQEPRLLAEAVRRLRRGQVRRQPGFDGEFGAIRVFEHGERDTLLKQGIFFSEPMLGPPTDTHASPCPTPTALAEPEVVYQLPPETTETKDPSPPETEMRQPGLFYTVDVLAGLTDEQRLAADIDDAPVLIVAGPGTGKTRTLTSRIAHLVVTKGVDPREIVAVTFTNRAAEEMRARLQHMLGAEARRLRVSTFHALCLKILRDHTSAAGLPDGFRVIDQDEELRLMRAGTGLGRREATAALKAIASARRNGEDSAGLTGYEALATGLADAKALSLDTIIPTCLRLLRAPSAIRAGLGIRWLCVDEFQDINRIQYDLVRLLAGDGRRLCVIGDPDQAIYGFRGADVGCFLRFPEDFPETRVVELTRNFRSTDTIVSSASSVIAPGRVALSSHPAAAAPGGLVLRRHRAPSGAAEAEFIAHEIEKWLGGTAMFSVDSDRVAAHSTGADDIGLADIAVLARLRALLPPVAAALSRLGLPIQTIGDRSFIEQPGARDFLAALRQSARDFDRPAAAGVARFAARNSETIAGGRDGMRLLEECRAAAEQFAGSLGQFVDALLLRSETDRYDAHADRLPLMTLHAAKGLEFRIVFIVGCEDGILPYAKDGETPDLAEERRLLYVGMTRARQVLYLSHAARRTLFGRSREAGPCPFAAEIADSLQQHLVMPKRKARAEDKQLVFDFG